MHLQDTTAIITGAARGLGLEFTRSILTAGGRVFMTDIDETELSASCKLLQEAHPGRVSCMRQNVIDMDSFDAAFDAANRAFHPYQVNVLVNNAGIGYPYNKFYTDKSTNWTRLVDVNLSSVIRGTQVALRRLSSVDGKRPVVVNVASFAAFTTPHQGPVYAATKAAVVAFTKAAGKSPSGIRVVALCPAFVDTPLMKPVMSSDPKFVAKVGLMTTAYVAEAFALSIKDEDNSGAAMAISTQQGFQYIGLTKNATSKL
ncbi:Aste57867_9961 [Aphanomyces stellatus]|uniref:Aste57867_9961 protein n=1 Tax=Aphanomyces stellatus TaxID=120398 RepID=A0A485KQ21_9STRA|nr:hypothetical protein As57867_009922 [Aphanomyces stellatus]VFT86839.1 Aste57867_9961 [Aphanomyces stellatus]